MRRLLDRGFLLAQVVERWQARAIWVISRADSDYPRRLKESLREDAPPVIYGCGDKGLLEAGGLAVVGSRNANETLLKYAANVGKLTALANRTLVSGGARGVDQAAMSGAIEAGGTVSGVLADSLEKATLNREYRNRLLKKQLVLISPYDPNAGFNKGHAMQRNKLIYRSRRQFSNCKLGFGKGEALGQVQSSSLINCGSFLCTCGQQESLRLDWKPFLEGAQFLGQTLLLRPRWNIS